MTKLVELPDDLLYASPEVWIFETHRGHLRIGVTEYLLQKLKDVVTVELPEKKKKVKKGKELIQLESFQTTMSIKAPFDGVVFSVNKSVISSPELISQRPYQAWLVEIKPAANVRLDLLLDADDVFDSVADDLEPIDASALDDELDDDEDSGWSAEEDLFKRLDDKSYDPYADYGFEPSPDDEDVLW